MTDHNHGVVKLMTLRDAGQSVPCPLSDIGEPFSTGYLKFRWRGSPTH